MMAKAESISAVRNPRTTSSSLERLYARRVVLDAAIKHLEDYCEYRSLRLVRPQRPDERQRRSA